jgi:phosphomannomutase
MLNISPIGRNCSQSERDDFDKYDKEHKIREQLVKVLEEEFKDYGLKFAIGGQISIDIFPEGWDKTYCLQFVDHFEHIHFFGDRTLEGGNDYEIYSSTRTIGHSVKSYNDTIEQLGKLFDL